MLKYREIKMPDVASSDVKYYTLFLCALLLMLLSAVVTATCFNIQKNGMINASKTTTTPLPVTSSDTVVETPDNETAAQSLLEKAALRQEDLLGHATMISALLFLFSFFLSLYAHVKSGLSLCNYLLLCWSSNLEWSIEEYKHSRDSQYLTKLEELRRKINEKQKKSPDEVEPLRSSVIVIE